MKLTEVYVGQASQNYDSDILDDSLCILMIVDQKQEHEIEHSNSNCYYYFDSLEIEMAVQIVDGIQAVAAAS